MKYLVKSSTERGLILKYGSSKFIVFDTEEEAKQRCTEMINYIGYHVVPAPIDEDILLALPTFIFINNKDIDQYRKNKEEINDKK